MSFESGLVSFRIFYVNRTLPKNLLEKFIDASAPALQSMGIVPVHGWVGGQHLLDLPITEENAYFGGYLRLALLKAERKVPTSLLRAECMLEEMIQMRAEGKPFIDRKTRSLIRKDVMSRLMPQMPPTLKGIPFVYDERAKLLYATALSEKQLDAFHLNFRTTSGVELIPVAADTAAAKRANVRVREWNKTSFSPEVPDDEMEDTPGLDFLTWLWFASEARGGVFKSENHGKIAFVLEGPLLFMREGSGAHETTLRKGLPTVSEEAKAALLSGKKLRRAKLTFGQGDDTWSCSIDADTFVFRSLKLPEPREMLDSISRFQDRMLKLDLFQELFFELFDRFINERSHPKKWSSTKKEIHQWVSDRTTKK